MTPTPHIETIRKFAFEGPFPVSQLAIVGLVAAVIIGWFSWRDYKAAASVKLFFGLFFLRVAALLVVLWMLAGASVVTLSRELKPKSVVFLVDSSASMGLVDPVDGSGSTLRWSAAQSAGKQVPTIGALDRAIGRLQAAQSALTQLRRANHSLDPNEPSKDLWSQIGHAIDAAGNELSGITLDVGRTDQESSLELTRAAAFLKGGLAAGSGNQTSDSRTRQSRNDRLDEAEAFIQAGLRRVERLSQKLSASYEQNPSSREQSDLAAQSRLSRKEKVAAWLEAAEGSWLKDLETKARVSRYEFAGNVVSLPDKNWRAALTSAAANGSDGVTDLGAALGQAAQEAARQSVDAVVLATDGGHNAPGDPREIAATLRGVPLLVVPIGSTEIPRDVILHHVHCPRAAFKNDTVLVDAMVTTYGCAGEEMNVELLSDDKEVTNQTLTAASKVFDGRVNFRWKAAELGRHVLKVRVAPLPKEHSIDDNEAQAEVEVLEDTIHVLIGDNSARWEFRYLVNLFKRDKHIGFEQLLFEPRDESKPAPSFPRDLDAWSRYRVVILGDVSPAQFPAAQQELLKRYISEQGGNLIVIAGETAMPRAFAGEPLADLVPSETSAASRDAGRGYGLTVTAEGSASVATQLEDDPLASDRIWREMSAKLPIYNLSAIAKPKPTSHVLIAAASDRPGAEQEAFLSWQYVGLGRVVYVSAPVTYQLRYRKGDMYHHRFWGQLLRWAIARDMTGGSKTVRLVTDKNSYEKGDPAQIVLRLSHMDGQPASGAQCNIEAFQSDKMIKLVELHEESGSPGAYEGTWDALPTGSITLRAAGATVQSLLTEERHSESVEHVIRVDPKGSTELNNPICNLPLLSQIADASGGSLIPPAAVQDALANLNAVPEVQDSVLSREAVWNRWYLLWIFIGCLTLEWVVRRHKRML